jgi:hypothetical protein
MKFKIDIECTPQEARDFFGLPNVETLNKAIMDHAQEQMTSQMSAMDPETFMNTWMPAGTKMMENFQQQFFSQFGGEDKGKK